MALGRTRRTHRCTDQPMQDANGVLAVVDFIGGNAHAIGVLIIVIGLAIIVGLPYLERSLPRRRRHR